MTDLASLNLEGLTRFVVETLSEKPFRAKQIFRWVHQRGVTDFAQMTDLSKALRERLQAVAQVVHVTKDL